MSQLERAHEPLHAVVRHVIADALDEALRPLMMLI